MGLFQNNNCDSRPPIDEAPLDASGAGDAIDGNAHSSEKNNNSKGGIWLYVEHECEDTNAVQAEVARQVFGDACTQVDENESLKLIFEGLLKSALAPRSPAYEFW